MTIAAIVFLLILLVSLGTFLLVHFGFVLVAILSRAVLLVLVFNGGSSVLADLLAILGLVIIVLVLDAAGLLAVLVFLAAGVLVVAPLAMELTHGVIPKLLAGLAQVVVVLPPGLELVSLARLPVLEAVPIGLGNLAPKLPLGLEKMPCGLEDTNDLLEELLDGTKELGNLLAEAFLWTGVGVLAAIGVLLWLVVTTITLGCVARTSSGIAVVLLIDFYFHLVGLAHDLRGADNSSCRGESEEGEVLHCSEEGKWDGRFVGATASVRVRV